MILTLYVAVMGGVSILGCLTATELKLMQLELVNCRPQRVTDEKYFWTFSWMVNTAAEHNWGLLAVTNVNEEPLARIASPGVTLDELTAAEARKHGLIETNKGR